MDNNIIGQPTDLAPALGESYDYVGEEKKLRAQVDAMSIADKLGIAGKNQAFGVWYRTQQTKAEAPKEVDQSFVDGVQARIQRDRPMANENVAAMLGQARNEAEYVRLLKLSDDVERDRQLISKSTIATAATMALDVAPDLATGIGLTSAAGKLAFGAARTALAVGGNALASGSYEYLRQKAALEEQNLTAVGLTTLVAGAAGGVFDAMSPAMRAKVLNPMRKAMSGVVGAKPIATVVDDAAEAAATAEAKAATSVEAKLAAQAPVMEAKAGTQAAKDLAAAMRGDASMVADDSVDLLAATPARVVADAPVESSAIKAFMAEVQGDAAEHLAATKAAAEVVETPSQREFRQAFETHNAPQPVVEPVVPQAAAVSAVESAVPAVAPAVAAADAKVLAVESAVPQAMTAGRLTLKDVETTFKPVFESPVDRALATVGSASTPSASEVALGVLRKAFPGVPDEGLVGLAEDYVSKHLVPTLRTSGKTEPKVQRWWNRLTAPRDPAADMKALTREDIAQFTDASMPHARLTQNVADADGSLLKRAVASVNKYVTADGIANGFSAMAKKHPGAAALLDKFVAGFKEAYGKAPDLAHVRQFAADELYARALAVSSAAAKYAPKMMLFVGGGIVVSFAMTNDAEAGDGSAMSRAGLNAIMGVGSLLLGGKALRKVLNARGVLSKQLIANEEKAAAMLAAGADEKAIEEATGFVVHADEAGTTAVYYKADPNTFPELKPGVTPAEFDKVAAGSVFKPVAGEASKPVVSFQDGITKAFTKVTELGSVGYETMTVMGQRIATPFKDGAGKFLRPDFQRLNDDVSPTLRGLGQLVAAGNMTRVGKVATAMSADVAYQHIYTTAVGNVTDAFQRSMKDWYAESGLKRPSVFNVTGRAREWNRFAEEVAKAKQFPDDLTVSAAAKKAAGAMAQEEAAMLQRLKKTMEELEAAGVHVPEDSPLRTAANIEPDSKYLSRVVSKDKWLNVEAQVGADGVKKLLTEGFIKANPSVALSDVPKIIDTVYMTLKSTQDGLAEFITKDKALELVSALRAKGIDDKTIAVVQEQFALKTDSVVPGFLKGRTIELDMSAGHSFNIDGKTVNLTLADLYERDALKLFGRWSHGMAGIEALGIVGKQISADLTDDVTWSTLLRKAVDEGADLDNVKMLEAYRNLALGRGKDTDIFGMPHSVERTVRSMANFWLGENFMLAQLGDLGGLGARGVGNLLKNLPYAVQLQRAIGGGAVSHAELKNLASLTDLCADSVSASVSQISDGVAEVGAGIAENLVHLQSKLNLMHMVSNASRLAKAKEMLDDIMAHARGEAVDERVWKHYSAFGIDKATVDDMAGLLKKHAMYDEDGAFVGMNKEAFMADNLGAFRTLQLALHRAGKSANAEAAGWGESAQFFRASAAGRFIGQLQRTALFITQRSMKDIKNFDALVAQAWTMSFGFAMASYMARTALRYSGDPEEMDKRLTARQLLMGGVRQASFTGLWPNLVDAFRQYVLQKDPLFANQTTTGRNGGGELAVQAAVKTPLQAMAGLAGLISTDTTDRFTQSEAFALKRTLAPIWWLTPVIAYATADMPTKNDPKPKSQDGEGK